MRRICELVSLVKAEHPRDHFFANFHQTLAVPELRADYQAYERALSFLDPASWTVLQTKAVSHFSDHRPGQLKQGFFNQLNDAFAYRHLVRRGYQEVRVLSEIGSTQPDLEYLDGNKKQFCEVKTLGISNNEISRRNTPKCFRSAIYYELGAGFIRKLESTLDAAQSQINARGTNGMIYLLVFFDDFTLEHYDTYRKQVHTCIHKHHANNVYVKVGFRGNRHIQKSPISATKRGVSHLTLGRD